MTGPNKRPLAEFWDFFSQLPSHSKTKAKIAADPRVAREQVNSLSEEYLQEILEERANPEQAKNELTTEGYDMYISKMNEFIDEMKLLRYQLSSMLGAKGGKFHPVKRPKTEYEKKLEERLLQVDKKNAKETMAEFGF